MRIVPETFRSGFPHQFFTWLRQHHPVYWHEPTDNTPDGEGFWSVATYAETLEVLRDPVTYSSVTGGVRPYGGTLLRCPVSLVMMEPKLGNFIPGLGRWAVAA